MPINYEPATNSAHKEYGILKNMLMRVAEQAKIAAEAKDDYEKEFPNEDIWEGTEALDVAGLLKQTYVNFMGGDPLEAEDFFK